MTSAQVAAQTVPVVTLTVSPTTISEGGDDNEATVTASLDRTFSAEIILTVSATAVDPATDDDFELAGTTLTIADGQTTSTGTVTITAVDNNIDGPDSKTVTVEAALFVVIDDVAPSAPDPVTLTITDDDEAPGVTPAPTPDSGETPVRDPGATPDSGETPVRDPGAAPDSIAENLAPAFDMPTYTFELEENRDGSRTPIPLGSVSATDPDADTLSYAIAQGDRSRFALDRSSSALTYVGGGENFEEEPRHLLTVRATDPGGLSATARVIVMITGVNEAPVSEAIPNRTLHLGGEAVALVLSDYFSDPDGDPLRYEAVSSDESVATSRLAAAGDLSIVPLGVGTAAFTITATDSRGLSAEQSFAVKVEVSEHDRAPALRVVLSGFGRTVATSLVDAIDERFSAAAPAGGSQAVIGGQRLDFDAARSTLGRESDAGKVEGWGVGGRLATRDGTDSHALSPHEFLSTSSFRIALAGDGTDGGENAGTLWGRGKASHFESRLREVAVDGYVTSLIMGIDQRWNSGTGVTGAGIALSHDEGDIDYLHLLGEGAVAGTMTARLTGVYPYLHRALAGNLDVWGMVGYGAGETRLEDAGGAFETDLTMRMGALGARGALQPVAGVDLAVKGDAFAVRMESDTVPGLPSVEEDVWRLRLALEGSHEHELPRGGRLRPSVEIGLRRDGGDAEIGAGLELGAGLAYVDPVLGLTVEGRGRALLAHQDGGMQEWGAGGSVRIDPGVNGRGLSLGLAPSLGARASGVSHLWENGLAGSAAGSSPRQAPVGRLEAELGYGFPALGGRGLRTLYGALSLAAGQARTYRMGGRFELAPSLSLSLEGARRESPGVAPDHGVMLRGQLRF